MGPPGWLHTRLSARWEAFVRPSHRSAWTGATFVEPRLGSALFPRKSRYTPHRGAAPLRMAGGALRRRGSMIYATSLSMLHPGEAEYGAPIESRHRGDEIQPYELHDGHRLSPLAKRAGRDDRGHSRSPMPIPIRTPDIVMVYEITSYLYH